MESLPPITAEMLVGLKDRPEVLIELIVRQAGVIEELQSQVAMMRAKVAELEGKLGDQGKGPPPAAPFRRPDERRHSQPKRPGRKAGHPGEHRPRPDYEDEFVEVRLGPCCPQCQGELEGIAPLDQWIEDLPAIRPHVTHLRTWQGNCPRCERTVRSVHPAQVSLAGGAAGVHLGARALGAACALKHQFGLSFRKCSFVLEALGGLQVSAGGLAQAFQRTAERVRDDYDQLMRDLLAGNVVHTDETSWWLDGRSASLWVWCSPQRTCFRVVESRSRETFHQVIPPDWDGTLVSDCLSVYDEATPRQHKCYSHHLKAIKEAVQAGGRDGPESFLGRCRSLLHTAMALKADQDQLDPEVFAQRRRALDLAADSLLADPRIDRPQEERVRLRLRKQRDHLFVFLSHPEVHATNNLAERQLRPAVIARKLAAGNKTRAGADAWAILASLGATARQQALSFIDFLSARIPLPAR
jgi:transposase